MRTRFTKALSLIVFVIFSNIASAQDFGTFTKVEVGINGLGVALEMPVADRFTIEPAIGVGASYDLDKSDDSLTGKMGWHWAILEPSFHGSVYGKYFYNKAKRANKNKSLWINSGNFIGVKVKYVSKSLSSPQYYSNTILTNLNWGGQFNLGRHWMYSYSVGMGYGYNTDTSYGLFYPAFDLKIAYVLPFLNKKK